MATIPVDFKLATGTFVQRLNRFMVLARVGGENIYAHLPNSGRLTTTLYPGVKLYLRRHGSEHGRKSAYSVFAAQHNDDLTVIVDSQFSNRLFREAVERNLLDEISGHRIVSENVRVGCSRVRLDFLLEGEDGSFYAEVKSVTHVVGGVALFPDAITLRGRRQILQLISLLRSSLRAGIVFSVQRPDAILVKPNFDVDPGFASLLRVAVNNGLKILVLKAVFQPPESIRLKPNDPPFSF